MPKGTLIEVCISEVECRQNHIAKVEPNHTRLQIILDCLKDRDVERPSAQQLSERVAALKEGPQQCCGNYRSEVIDYNYDYFSLKMPNCNFNYYLHLKVTITTKKRIELHTITGYIIKVVQESEIHAYFI